MKRFFLVVLVLFWVLASGVTEAKIFKPISPGAEMVEISDDAALSQSLMARLEFTAKFQQQMADGTTLFVFHYSDRLYRYCWTDMGEVFPYVEILEGNRLSMLILINGDEMIFYGYNPVSQKLERVGCFKIKIIMLPRPSLN